MCLPEVLQYVTLHARMNLKLASGKGKFYVLSDFSSNSEHWEISIVLSWCHFVINLSKLYFNLPVTCMCILPVLAYIEQVNMMHITTHFVLVGHVCN